MTRARRNAAANGFTLIEVLVAMAVLSVAVVAALELFAGSLRLAGSSVAQTEALVLARSLMDEAMWKADLDDGEARNSVGRYDWSLYVGPVLPTLGATEDAEAVGTASGEYELKEIVVTVRWSGAGGEKAVVLESARIMEKY